MQKVSIYQFYEILEQATKGFPEPLAEHVFHWTNSPFFTLVSTVLSARTKDSLTITKLPNLWNRAKTPIEFSLLTTLELEPLLRPIGFYKTKARHLIELGSIIHNDYNDTVPDQLEELIKLPGVGRKTANLQLSVVNQIPAICVDTHVHRIMNHIGYVNTTTPEQTEKALRAKLPIDLWNKTNYLLVLTGQHLANHVQIKDPTNLLNQYEIIEEDR